MGQGQEFHARKMITDGMADGGWVMLQNVHLSISFCSEIIDILVETEHIEDSFRLWVTTEVHEEFPIGLLQMAIKFTNEPPQGIRASMKRSYQVKKKDKLLTKLQERTNVPTYMIAGIFSRFSRLHCSCSMAAFALHCSFSTYHCTRAT